MDGQMDNGWKDGWMNNLMGGEVGDGPKDELLDGQ